MSIEGLQELIDDSGQLATITVEGTDGGFPPISPMGGTDRSAPWAPVSEGVPCLVRPRSSTLRAWPPINDSRQNVIDATIYFYDDPVPTGISTRHRITVTTQGTGGNRVLGVYAVQGTIDPNSMGGIFQVEVERVRSTP